jgi:copper transport protein
MPHPLRTLAAVVATIVLALGAALWSAGAVSAHAELLGVTPADGAVVQDTPAQVVLRFSEHVSLTGGSARVLDAQAAVVSGDPRVEGDQVIIPLGGELPDGTYTVTWVAISEDSHPVSGATVFSIGAPTPGGGLAVAPGAPSAGWGVRAAAATLVALSYAGALVAVGGWWFLVVVDARSPGDDETEPAFHTRIRGLVGRAAVLGAVTAVASIPLRIARLGGGMGALRDNNLLGESLRGPIGVSTAVTAAGLLVMAGLVEPATSRRAVGRIAALVIGFVALAGFAIEGHTRSQHPIALMVAFDVVHLAAASVWLGGIAALVIATRSGPEPDVLGRIVGRFSTMAVVAVAAVIGAGTGMAILVLPSVGDLFSTGYGLAMLIKIALVLPVIAMGAYNNRRLVPAMSAGAAAAPERRRLLSKTVLAELVILLAVVGVTSVLVNRSPVAASAAAPAPVTTVAPSSVEVPLSSGAGTATYTLVPALPGQNEMVLTLSDPTGKPLVPIDVPTIELTEPALGVGPLRPIVHPVQDGEFHVIADIPLAGTYDMVIRVRVSDFVAVSATSTVTIGK